VISDGVIIDAWGLAGVVGADTATQRAWVWSGTRPLGASFPPRAGWIAVAALDAVLGG